VCDRRLTTDNRTRRMMLERHKAESESFVARGVTIDPPVYLAEFGEKLRLSPLLCTAARLSAIHRTEQRSVLASLCVPLNSVRRKSGRMCRELCIIFISNLYTALLSLHIVRSRHAPRTRLWNLVTACNFENKSYKTSGSRSVRGCFSSL
jgi:hypothetical protein